MLTLIFALSAFAMREFNDPGEGPRGSCPQNEVSACNNANAQARDVTAAAAAVIEERIYTFLEDKRVQSESFTGVESELSALELTAKMIEREIAPDEKVTAAAIFSSGPSPEEIFFWKNSPNSWGEVNSPERIARLNTQAGSLLAQKEKLEPLRQNLAMKIGALAEELNSLSLSLDDHRFRVKQHAAMCNGGCYEQICRRF